MSAAAPEHFGRYATHGVLGRGAMGVVYRAWDPLIARFVAIKTLAVAEEFDEEARHEFLARFQREARAAGGLNHPGIVVVHDFGEEGGQPFLAMELLVGRDLDHVLRDDGPLPPDRTVGLLRQVAQALDYAHAHGVIHRDLKPANLFLTELGIVKIMDFGIAHLQSGRLTRTGMSIGSPLYMSPEQILGRPVGPQSDVFSLGSTAYELLTGVPAFGSDNLASISFRVVYGEPDPPSRVNHAVPGAWDAVLARALVKNTAQRWPDAASFVAALEQALSAAATRLEAAADAKVLDTQPAASLVLPDALPLAEPLDSDIPLPSSSGPEGELIADASSPSPQEEAPEAPSRRRGLAGRLPAALARLPRPGHLPVAVGAVGLLLALAIVLPLRDRAPAAPGAAPVAATQDHLLAAAPPTPEAFPPPAPSPPAPAPPPELPTPFDVVYGPTPAEVATPGGAPTTPLPRDARLLIDGNSPLRHAEFRILLDGAVLWSKRVSARARIALGDLRLYREKFADSTTVPAGVQRLRVEIEDLDAGRVHTGTIQGTFRAGRTRRLEIGLGRGDREVELDWED